jgi:hypothetical protein
MKDKFRKGMRGRVNATYSNKDVGVCLDKIDGCVYKLNDEIDIKASSKFKDGVHKIKIISLEPYSKKGEIKFCKEFGKFLAVLEGCGFTLTDMLCSNKKRKKG